MQDQKITRDGNEFTLKTIISDEDTLNFRANFGELEPGNQLSFTRPCKPGEPKHS